ncbi:endonuclease/exonuclease/phosphatase family protein [Pedobacter sandarakinus]|uniref:endonuclease/exonuclease/phosphatase family protein n=1 Tax=Pedobacter sandarakinus TaxID=353156 RepID=UPI00224767D1|nr:endonuclease/exonuclease/phosphatase family protein [Pedobacter sandarakinus]MCX2574775.1 endonuclease/exonuclease/phosphatase family protein [Pedobacter sandarakinus]
MQQVLFYLGIFLIATTLIPFIRHDFWIFRVFEYPRLQKLFLNLTLGIAIAFFYFPATLPDQILFAALLINLIYLSYLIFPYTIFSRKQIVTSNNLQGDNNLKLLIANVYQENRRYKDYLKVIAECKPDVILLVETDNWWQKKIDIIGTDYPHQLKAPLDNTYGMLLYSRLKLDGEIKFLVEKDIPSIEAEVTLPSGTLVKIFCLHPQPPVPQENPRSTERDKEILMIGEKAKESKIPVIVMGDLNDVAWSYTTDLFGKISGLLDPRRGRGFFNSFNAKYFFLRFPLDHIFCSRDFALSSIKRLNSCGSDHFPMCVDLVYAPQIKNQNEVLQPTEAEKELAEEKINA